MNNTIAVLRRVRTSYGKQIRKAYESGQVYEKRSNMTEWKPRTDGISNTISTVQKDNLVYQKEGDIVRIRNLTPKECFRLMGFDDSDYEKAHQVNSNSQLYKEAGNSIVVDVPEKIFKQLLEAGILK